MKNKCIFAVLLLASLLLTACGGTVRAEHCELGINLPNGYKKHDTGGAFDLSYASDTIVVGITRISHSAAINDNIPPTLEPKGFCELYMSRAGHTGDVFLYGDVPYYTYTNTGEGGKSYTCAATFYRSPYAYFVITFITDSIFGASLEDMLSLTNGVYLILD